MKSKKGYVYLIKVASEPPRYKIGRTKNVHNRFKQLQECCPFPLKIIDYFFTDDMSLREKLLHEKMGKYRVYGEWFLLPPYLLLSLGEWFNPNKPSASETKPLLPDNKPLASETKPFFSSLYSELIF